MSMWEPFASPARASIVRAQEIAQRARHNYIRAEHIAYALTQSDGEVGRLMAGAVDRAAIEAMWDRPGAIAQEMVFTPGAKRVLEMAFENARRIGDSYVGEKHIALGLLDTTDPPPLLPGTDVAALRTALTAVAETPNTFTKVWRQVGGEAEMHSVAAALQHALGSHDLTRTGTRVTLNIAAPDEPERSWAWQREDQGAT